MIKISVCFRKVIRRWFLLWERDVRLSGLRNPYLSEPNEWDAPDCSRRLGIIEEPFQHHWPYIAACRELGVSYRLVRITDADWVKNIQQSGCDAFLVWPSMGRRSLREVFDNRLYLLEHQLGYQIYPAYKETCIYENKYRLADWLVASGLPHAETTLFNRERDAMVYAKHAQLPMVVKTRLGAASSGVWIESRRASLRRRIRQAFRQGLRADYRHRFESERGAVLLQEFIPRVREWRLVRIGDSFFGHGKGVRDGFHSGSGLVEWEVPSNRHLDFLYQATESGGFRSMAVDVFETAEGELLVNELQTVFGTNFSVDQMRVDGKPGRFVLRGKEGKSRRQEAVGGRQGEEKSNVEHRTSNAERRKAEEGEETDGRWQFEPGDFARNACCNLRVLDVLDQQALQEENG